MIANFAGTYLGADDLVSHIFADFLPSGQRQAQVSRPVGASQVTVRSRGNAAWEYPITLILAPQPSSGAARALMTDFVGQLPDSGALWWYDDGFLRQVDNVVLEQWSAVDKNGADATIRLVFVGGAPHTVTGYLLDENGNPIYGDDGGYIETENGTNMKISDLPDAAPLDGTELVLVLQGGANKKTTAAKIAGTGPVRTYLVNLTVGQADYDVNITSAGLAAAPSGAEITEVLVNATDAALGAAMVQTGTTATSLKIHCDAPPVLTGQKLTVTLVP